MNLQIKSNQYGAFPCKTYYYIIDLDSDMIYHYSDNKLRKKELKQLWTYAFKSESEAVSHLSKINLESISPKKTLYGLKIRMNDNDQWFETSWFKNKRERDKLASFNRIIGGIRTHSFEEKKTLQQITDLCS